MENGRERMFKLSAWTDGTLYLDLVSSTTAFTALREMLTWTWDLLKIEVCGRLYSVFCSIYACVCPTENYNRHFALHTIPLILHC
jgi:hypothetical protein